MVKHGVLILAFVLVSGWTSAQDALVRAWVDDTTVPAEEPFWLFVEVAGETITSPAFTDTEHLIINVNNPQTFRRESTLSTPSGFRRHYVIKLSYLCRATKEGTIVVPPIEATVNGKKMKSDPIELTITKADPANTAEPMQVRVWVNRRTIPAGEWFWIYVEATGFDVEMPETLVVDGLTINASQVSNRSVTSSFSRTGVSTYKRGYYAKADKPGTITVSPIEILVSRRMSKSNSLKLLIIAPRDKVARQANTPPPASPTPAATPSEAPQLTRADLVFIMLDTDKTDVYLGEQILMRTQLWQIIYRDISTGPLQGTLNIPPTTEGFYVDELEPLAYETTRSTWRYNVHERRKLLYPTKTGELAIGAWHWEGVALVNRHSIRNRERFRYKEDEGPIRINVKQLPPAPKGFAGAVGDYQVESSLDSNTGKTGVPIQFTIVVRGQGNPDAIGAPDLPKLDWAHVSDPERTSRLVMNPGESIPATIKTFRYEITPLRAGSMEIPSFTYAHFNPIVENYGEDVIGPFPMNIQSGGEAPQHLVVADDVSIGHRSVDILHEDIQPMLEPSASLSRVNSGAMMNTLGFVAPVIAYFALAIGMYQRRRLRDDVGYARARVAKHKGIRGLQDVFSADEPSDILFRVVSGYVGDKFNAHDHGMTSADVDALLTDHEVDETIRTTITQILKSCERARYASQELTQDELRALVQAAESSIHDFDAWLKGRKRS
ncbi:MAG: BatD family protein [Candidatus Hydrogenedentota bacterium]